MDISMRLERFIDEVKAPADVLANNVIHDLTANFKKYSLQSSLTQTEAMIVVLAAGLTLRSQRLTFIAKELLSELGLHQELTKELVETSALMKMNNTYYKFRSCVSDDKAFGHSEHYSRSGLRMQSLTQNQNKASDIEIVSFSVSILNACGICVRAHEKKLLEQGFSHDKVHDVARLTAVVAGLDQYLETKTR